MPAFAVNVPPVPAKPLPNFNTLEPPFKVPAVLVQVPVNVCVSPAPRLSVPPVPLIVSAPPFTLPVKVAVPAVLVIDTFPVVVKPAMLPEVVPLSITLFAPKFKVPPPVLRRFPRMVRAPAAVVVPVPLKVRF